MRATGALRAVVYAGVMARALLVAMVAAAALAVAWVARAEAEPDALAALLRRIDAVSREVARVRGLPLKRPIPNEVVDRAELRARLVKMAAEEKTAAESAAEAFALERWGMIPPGLDYESMIVDLLTEQSRGTTIRIRRS